MKDFSFIVLFHNNMQIDRVIKSIINQMTSDDELIIVNDNSYPQNMYIIEQFDSIAKIVHASICGNRAFNRNYGASFATKDILFFVDGDIILLPGCVESMKISILKGYIGAVGNVISGNNTPAQMNLLTGIDYLDFCNENINLERLATLNLLSDRRQKFLIDKIATNSLWEYFFSAYAVIKKSVFNEIGGFDTRFIGWGVEDDEIGYRLSKSGGIEYNKSAYGVHIPHERDLYKCLYNNRVNLYRFLAKSPTNEVEIHMVFGYSIMIEYSMQYIKNELLKANTYVANYPEHNNCIYINELTLEHPRGYVMFTSPNGEKDYLNLLGMALPFKNDNFDTAFLSENIFCYPETIVSIILGEALRVAREVRIIKVNKHIRIKWNTEQLSGLKNISTSTRIIYIPNRICDFNIIDKNEYYIIDGGIAQVMNDDFVLTENFYKPEFFNTQPLEYIMLNLSGTSISEEYKNELQCELGIKIINIFNAEIQTTESPIKLKTALAGDLFRLHTPILYIITHNMCIDKLDGWWSNPFREYDLIKTRS